MTTAGSPPVTKEIAAWIKLMLALGYFQHDIAAFFGMNQGRVSEIKTGKLWSQVPPARDLPPDFT